MSGDPHGAELRQEEEALWQLHFDQTMNSGFSTRCAGGYETIDDAMDTALEMLRSQNEWLLQNRAAINAKIQRGISELDRGEGIPKDELDAYLDKLKAEPE